MVWINLPSVQKRCLSESNGGCVLNAWLLAPGSRLLAPPPAVAASLSYALCVPDFGSAGRRRLFYSCDATMCAV